MLNKGKVIKTEKGFSVKALPKEESLEQKIERLERQIQQDSITNFEVLATIYEELIMKG